MKITPSTSQSPHQQQTGSAVLVILILVIIMVVLAASSTATLNRLRQRMKIIEQRQTQRLNSYATNSVHTAGANINQPNPR